MICRQKNVKISQQIELKMDILDKYATPSTRGKYAIFQTRRRMCFCDHLKQLVIFKSEMKDKHNNY